MLSENIISISQSGIPERNGQVARMLELYQRAQTVLTFLGSDSEDGHAKVAIEAVEKISNFRCEKLQISLTDPISADNVYQEILLMTVDRLPAPRMRLQHRCPMRRVGLVLFTPLFYPGVRG
jgi:hypothetical protein